MCLSCKRLLHKVISNLDYILLRLYGLILGRIYNKQEIKKWIVFKIASGSVSWKSKNQCFFSACRSHSRTSSNHRCTKPPRFWQLLLSTALSPTILLKTHLFRAHAPPTGSCPAFNALESYHSSPRKTHKVSQTHLWCLSTTLLGTVHFLFYKYGATVILAYFRQI